MTGHWPPLPPNINREDPPEFYRMSSTRFEEMTCSLVDKEPGVLRADLYHTRYDAQYGIDCFGDLSDGMIVASCKCQKSIKKGEIATWSSDFLNHWDTHWKKQGVRKFILSTAAPTGHRNRLVDIAEQRARFAAVGIEYAVWSPRQLQEHLRPHRGLVSQFVGPAFVDILCGEGVDPALLGKALAVQAELEDRVGGLSAALTDEVEQRYAVAKEFLEKGTLTKAIPIVSSLRSQENFAELPGELRARIIRLRASIALTEGDMSAAAQFSDEADSIHLPDEPRIKAHIALMQFGPTRAIEVLGTPKSEHGRGLLAALLLSLNRWDEAKQVISALSDTAERLRLDSLLHLFSGDRLTAKELADAAMARAPDNLDIRRLGVKVRYALAFSDLAEPQQYFYAAPVPGALFRSDKAAIEMLWEALNLVDSIIALGEQTSKDMDWPWRLACLANLPDKRAEAAEQAQRMLTGDPMNAIAIGWVLVRALPVDLKPSREMLGKALTDGTLRTNGARALEWTTEPKDRAALLDDVIKALASHDWTEDVREELNTLVGRLGGAVELSGDAEAARRLEAAIASGKPSAVIFEFRRLREQKPTPILLLGAGEILANMKEWNVIAEGLAEILAFNTAEAIRLAAYAAFNSGDDLQALSILGENISAFPGARLPLDLRRMEAVALARRGEGQQAAARAESLAAETQDIRDRIWEARIRFDVGDLRGAAHTIRLALGVGQLAPTEALWWAGRLAQQDRELAQHLWRSAVSSGPLPDEVAAGAYQLSFELGLEHERPELAAVLPRLAAAGSSGVQMVSIDHLSQLITERRERAAHLDELLTKGDAPIHLIAHAANASLAEMYRLSDGSEAGLNPIFVRSAARAIVLEEAPWNDWALFIDITGLMISDQLGLLGFIEAHQKPPRIARSTIEALIALEERIRHPQPRRVAAAEAILGEVGKGVRLIAPEAAQRVVHQPGEDDFGIGDIVDGLEAGGWIDASAAATARRSLNLGRASGKVPKPRQPLIFAEQTLDQLADADLLAATIAGFDVYIDANALELTRAETRKGQKTALLISWIGALRDRISQGIQAGRYIYGHGEIDFSDDELKNDPVYRSLLELMKSSEAEGTNRLWIDDRVLNSYVNAGQSRVIGVVEVLEGLRKSGGITDDIYFDSLRKLRVGGALFIPLSVEEITRHLLKAPIVSGSVAETPALASLRRNAGLALAYQDALRLAPEQVGGEIRPSELPFLINYRRVVEGAIIECWNGGASLADVRARCDWIWASLRAELPPSALPGRPPNDPLLFASLNIADLIASGLRIEGSGKEGHERRKAYFEWIGESVGGRLDNDAKLADAIGKQTRMMLRTDQVEGIAQDDAQRQAMRQASKLVVFELPTALQNIVAADEGFRRDLGIDAGGIISIEGKEFFEGEFWAAMELATNGETAAVQTADRALNVTISPPNGNWVFPVSGAVSVSLSDPMAGILSRNKDVQQERFAALIALMDIPKSAKKGLRAELTAATTAGAKMRIVMKLRDRSIPNFLRLLAEDLRNQTSIKMVRFKPPSAAHWLHYMRWSSMSAGALEASLAAALDDLGPVEAGRRYASLPIILPRPLEQPLESESPERLTMVGLNHRLHSLRLSGRPTNPDLADATDDVVRACQEHGALLLALLRWGARSFMQQEDWPSLSVGEKHAVIWCYAGTMAATLLAENVDPDAMAEFFNERLALPAARSLNLEPGYDNSPLHAGALSEVGILLAGLEYGLSSNADDLKLNDDQLARLRAATSVATENGELMGRPERALSFLLTPYPTWLSRTTPNAVIENAGQIEFSLAEIVEQLESDPERPDSWDALIAFGRPALPPGLVDRMEKVVQRVDLQKLCDQDPDKLLAIRKVGEIAGRLVTKDASDRILNELFALSRSWLADPGDVSFKERMNAIVEAAANAARSYDGTGPKRLSTFLRALIANIDGVAGILRPVLGAIVDDTRVSEAGDFWKALLAARASR